MILTEAKNTVLTSGNIVSRNFQIKASKKAFEILSSGLYSDKISSIVREVSTNAYDGHTAAGTTATPFHVHLPNYMEPWFAVEDYGTGLSEEKMMTLYTTYFESDKTGSNDFTGALGLGSKSPFSYTDSFTVESRQDGVKKTYTAYLDGDGLPSITKMTEDFTQEPNGLTVKFPVKSGDFTEFRDKAKNALKWFKVRPTIGGNQIEFDTPDYMRETPEYAVWKKEHSQSYAVMGNIAYPMTAYEIFGYGTHDRVRSLVDWGVVLFLNIGDVEIAASREKLSYTKETVNFLKAKISSVIEDMEKEVTKDIANAKTVWQARQMLHKVRSSFKSFNFKAEWNNQPLIDWVKIKTVDDVPVADAQMLSIKSRKSNKVIVKKSKIDQIYADDTPVFLNDDRGSIARVRHWLENQKDDARCILLSDYSPAWLKETGLDEVAKPASSLPKPPRAVYTYGGRQTQKAKVYEYVPQGNNGTGAGAFWKAAEVDVEEEDGVYVEILYFSWRNKDDEATRKPEDLKGICNLLHAAGKGVKIYGIRPADKGMLEDTTWMTLQEYVRQVVDELKPALEPLHDLVRQRQGLGSDYYNPPSVYKVFKNVAFKDGSLFAKFVQTFCAADAARENKEVANYANLKLWLNIRQESDPSLDILKDEVELRYPLLKFVRCSYSSDEFKVAVTNYVNSIDWKTVEM